KPIVPSSGKATENSGSDERSLALYCAGYIYDRQDSPVQMRQQGCPGKIYKKDDPESIFCSVKCYKIPTETDIMLIRFSVYFYI
ncbi:TPA: hypothetical protein ACKQDC_005014, partial [Serratia marcescens]